MASATTTTPVYKFRSAEEFHMEYHLGEESLGKGGFGSVYPAVWIIDNRKVAIKRVPLWNLPSCWSVSSDTPVIPKEVEILTKAQVVPGVIRLYDFWRDETDLIIVMERNENARDLMAHIQEHGVFEEPEAAEILRQLIKTLLACQEKNIFHRDVKLENILYDRTTGQVTLIDFGCGEITTDPHQTFSSYMGTPDYIPPEFFHHNEYEAEAATVWSVGCIAFMMVFGYKPFYSKKDIMKYNITMDNGTGSMCFRSFIKNCLSAVPSERATLESLLCMTFLVENLPRISEPAEGEEEDMKKPKRGWQKERNFLKSEEKPSLNHPETTGFESSSIVPTPVKMEVKTLESDIPTSATSNNDGGDLQVDFLLKQICGEMRYIRSPVTTGNPSTGTTPQKISTMKRPRDESFIAIKLLQSKMMRKY